MVAWLFLGCYNQEMAKTIKLTEVEAKLEEERVRSTSKGKMEGDAETLAKLRKK